jgi:hypothetical protein
VEAVETKMAPAGLTAFKPAETVAGKKKNRGQLRPGSRTLCKPVCFPFSKRSPKGCVFSVRSACSAWPAAPLR